MGYDPKQPRDEEGQWTVGGSGGSNPRRWGRMNSTEKAKLTASAQFSSKTTPGKTGKLPRLGSASPRMQSPKPFSKSEPNVHAVAITTAKALDRDFHSARKKADQTAMHAALAKSNVPVVKYPSKKPKR